MMGSSRVAAWIAGLLVAASVAGCATQAGDAIKVSDDRGHVYSIGKSTIGRDELIELVAQPGAEKRRRLDAVLAAHPDDLAARYLRLTTEVDGEDEVAVLSDSQVLLADPNLSSRLRLRVLAWRAEALVYARRPDEAIPLADEALAIDAKDPEALFARGWARYHQDEIQSESALADLERALEIAPDQGIGYYRRAVVLQARGVLDRAAQDFESAVRLVPDDVPTRLAYGDLLIQTKDHERALAQFDAAVRLSPDSPAAWVGREQADFALKRFDDVISDARRAFELGAKDEDLANAHSFLASALWHKFDYAGAAREFQSALEFGDDHRIARSLALMQWFSGQLPQAIRTFREQSAWPDSGPYAPLWLFIARVQSDATAESAASAELVALAPSHQTHVWGDTVVDLMLGRTSIEAALVEADAADTNLLRAGRRCEADYYAAERLLLHGQRDRATGLLDEAYWVCPSTYTEASAVEWERRRLATIPR